jgi:hypothetical protein
MQGIKSTTKIVHTFLKDEKIQASEKIKILNLWTTGKLQILIIKNFLFYNTHCTPFLQR